MGTASQRSSGSTNSASLRSSGSTKTASSSTNEPRNLGSINHDPKRCKPCLFLNTHAGCKQGIECPFCHIAQHRRGKRACKQKRDRYQRIIASMDEAKWLST